MSLNPARNRARNPAEPVLHDLPAVRYGGGELIVRIMVRRADEGWRARLVFGEGDPEQLPSTAEIFYASHEADLWQSVKDLRDHHICDLYRAVAE